MDAPEALAEQGETSHSGLSGDRLLDRPPPLLPRRLLPAFLSAVTYGPFSPFPTLTNLCCVQPLAQTAESWDGARLGPLAWAAAPPESPGAHARTSLPGSVFKDDAFRLPSCHQGPPVDDELMPTCLLLTSVVWYLNPSWWQLRPNTRTPGAGVPGSHQQTRQPLGTLRTTPVRRALGVPAPPPVQPIYIRCLPSSPSVSPPTHRFVVSSGPLNSTSSKEPRRPRIVNAWTEEVEELPWSSTSSGGSPGVSRPPRAAMLLPGLGRSHHLESSVVQDLEPATPAPSSSIIGKLGWKWPSWGALRRAKEKTQAVAPASEAVSELQ
ncbi:hypothetical protein CapIbe_017985 [Capra ibex]